MPCPWEIWPVLFTIIKRTAQFCMKTEESRLPIFSEAPDDFVFSLLPVLVTVIAFESVNPIRITLQCIRQINKVRSSRNSSAITEILRHIKLGAI